MNEYQMKLEEGNKVTLPESLVNKLLLRKGETVCLIQEDGIKDKCFKVTTENEKEIILNNSEKLGFKTFENYARKMLIDGYVINLKSTDDKDLKYLMSEVSRMGNNINQITKRVNTISQIYSCDIEEIKQSQQEIVHLLRYVVKNINKIKNC